MANSALLDELLKQFAENPRRVFARLANEYRKLGELENAIQICRSFVPQQPTYISGHIVLGQALYESGQLDEARSTFETALSLDPENLIALRQLGDIAHAKGEIDTARSWYQRLLEVDPQNEEVAELLRGLGPSSASPGGAGSAGAGGDPVTWHDINPERVPSPAESALGGAGQGGSAQAVGAFDLTGGVSFGAMESGGLRSPAAGEGRVGGAPPEPPADPFGTVYALPGTEGAVPSEPSPFLFGGEVRLPGDPAAGAEATPGAGGGSPTLGGSAGEVSGASGTGGAFVTETMAELYLQQGFPDRALAIYRQLAAQRPSDVALRERIAQLERGEVGEREGGAGVMRSGRSVREFFGALAYRRPPARVSPGGEPATGGATSAPAGRGAESEGQPEGRPGVAGANGAGDLTGLFGGQAVAAADEDVATALAGAFSEEYAGERAPIAGRPARAATDELSLADVFRDESSHSAGERSPSTNVSFDEFFSRRDGEAAGGESGEAPPPAPQNPKGDDNDLELFHAWLEGLKK